MDSRAALQPGTRVTGAGHRFGRFAAVLVAAATTSAWLAVESSRADPDEGGLETPAYDIRLDPERIEARQGDEGALSLTIAPVAGLRIDRRGPLRIDLTVAPSEGLELVRSRYRRKHAADARADAPRFDLRYRAQTPGAYRVSLELRFWVCRKHTCWQAREQREVGAVVSAVAPEAGPTENE